MGLGMGDLQTTWALIATRAGGRLVGADPRVCLIPGGHRQIGPLVTQWAEGVWGGAPLATDASSGTPQHDIPLRLHHHACYLRDTGLGPVPAERTETRSVVGHIWRSVASMEIVVVGVRVTEQFPDVWRQLG